MAKLSLEMAKRITPCLKVQVGMIDEAFINRPTPAGQPWELAELADRFSNMGRDGGVSGLLEALMSLTDREEHWRVRSQSGEGFPTADEEERIRTACDGMRRELGKVIASFHRIWERPFPAELADGPPHVSSIFEHILRKLRTLLLEIITYGEMAPEELARKGHLRIDCVIEAPPEAARWLDARGKQMEEQAEEEARDQAYRERHPVWSHLKDVVRKNPGWVLKIALLNLFSAFLGAISSKKDRRS